MASASAPAPRPDRWWRRALAILNAPGCGWAWQILRQAAKNTATTQLVDDITARHFEAGDEACAQVGVGIWTSHQGCRSGLLVVNAWPTLVAMAGRSQALLCLAKARVKQVPPVACLQVPEKLAAWLREYKGRREQQEGSKGGRAAASPGAAANNKDGWRGYRLLLLFALWVCNLRTTLIYFASGLLFIGLR
jgi:hypothetical protein